MEEHYQPVNKALMIQYDNTMRAYYQRRTRGKIDRAWSWEMSALLSKESRPHMKPFLEKKGSRCDDLKRVVQVSQFAEGYQPLIHPDFQQKVESSLNG